MNILVTGGAGFIGSNFIRYILGEHPEYKVINLDKLTYSGNPDNLKDIEDDGHYRFIHGDICDRLLVNKLFDKYRFDAVFNFAAESHVDRSIRDPSPFIDTNVKGTQVLLEAARTHWGNNIPSHTGKKFIHISTDEVYGSLGKNGSFSEESPLQPNNPYSASKAGADLLCRSYYKAYGLPVIITRSSNNYGPCQYPEKLIPVAICNSLNGKEIPVYGEGRQVRDWLFVEDNCRAIDIVLESGIPGEIYNIGGNCELSNINIVEKICEILAKDSRLNGIQPRIRFINDPRGIAHDFRYSLDCSKIELATSWKPAVNIDEGLLNTAEWYISNFIRNKQN